MVRLGSPQPLDIAKELASHGLQVFPARFRDKPPLVDWKKYQATDSHSMIERWFKGRGNLNYWVLTGSMSGYIVIDCDSPEGDAWWRERIGDEMDATAAVETSKGTHYWFKLDGDDPVASWSIHPKTHDTEGISFDFRADKTGVIVPPSTHESGHVYKWLRDLSHAVPVPAAALDGTYRGEAPTARAGAMGDTAGTGGQMRSMLSRLLSQPPGGEGTGRNDWLARVAGHYAKTYHSQHDLYEFFCDQANNLMADPLDEAEYTKTITSIWRGEHERNTHRSIDASCGHLASADTTIQCQVVLKNSEGERDYEFVEYADFDLRAKGVMTDDSNRRTYWAEIVRDSRSGGGKVERIDVVLRAEVLGDDRAFRKFLAGFAATIVPPDNMWPKAGSPGVRIQRYLESQDPPAVTISPTLGYCEDVVAGVGGFLTNDGAITANGFLPAHEIQVRADPRLKSGGIATHDYGFDGTADESRSVLGRVLEFHDEAVCSVFGAWWAACLLKPQIEARTSLFPFVAIEAPSESGKTNGFFAMMLQLNGNTRGETQPTKPALRDMAAAHRNGQVWVDDLDDPAYLMELLRAATSGGSLTKMGEDRESVKNTPIVSPIVISGEALGLGTQKALVDRALLIKAGSPTGRRSRRDPTRPQWDDIIEVRADYPDGLHTIAGWFVQDALNVVPEMLVALKDGRARGSGRATDKVAVLRAGARLLDHLLRHDGAWDGQGEHALRVERWLRLGMVDDEGNAITSQENALTLELVPWALRKWKFDDAATAGEHGRIDTPVFIKGYDAYIKSDQPLGEPTVQILVNVALLSEAWREEMKGRQEKRTTTEDALRDQAMVLGFKSKRVRVKNGGGRLGYYFLIEGELALDIVRRAESQ